MDQRRRTAPLSLVPEPPDFSNKERGSATQIDAAWLRAGLAAAAALVAFLLTLSPAHGQTVPPDAPCIGCHVDAEGEIVLPSGQVLALDVDLEVLAESVHDFHEDGPAATTVFCTDCHEPDNYVYPHRPLPVDTLDEFAAMVSENCQRCHLDIEQHNPGHLVPELFELNPDLPTCADCHGGHAVAPAELLADDPVAFCLSCHDTFEEPGVAALHQEVMAELGPDQDCQTCHTDELASSVQAPSFATSEQCVACHGLLEHEIGFVGGARSLHVTEDTLMDSVHGERLADKPGYRPLLCVDCHELPGYQIFPHDVEIAVDLRQYVTDRSGVCQDCHPDVFEDQMDSTHAHALAAGNLNAATCVDCHGAHDIQPPGEPRQQISLTCGKCHVLVNNRYVQSVHGAALFAESNPDVPTCVDCHGVHGIPEPETALFRLRSPQVCAECHADEELMAKYGISTEVFDTYVADFHGTTVAIFEQTAPDQITNKAVCIDCHGVHNILPATDENSPIIKANLLDTCRQCHPTASVNFPSAWTSHFQPSLEHNPLVYFVDLFYDILIPALVGGFLLYVLFDIYRRIASRYRRGRES